MLEKNEAEGDKSTVRELKNKSFSPLIQYRLQVERNKAN